MSRNSRWFAFPFLVALGATLLFLSSAGTARAVSTTLVISQVYGGGGNAGATYTHDFIEIFNRGTTAVVVTGWTVQYASAGGTTWAATPLTGTIPAGGYYLVQEAQGAGGTTPLPAPDANGTIAMSAASGKVALVNGTTLLAGACPSSAGIVDFLGYGIANCFESTAAPMLTNTTAAARKSNGCEETDHNLNDFDTGAPTPRNSASPASSCQYLLDVTITPVASGTVDRVPDAATYTHGTQVSLTAVPATGYHFVGWSGDASGATNPVTVLMNGNKSVTATFSLDQYTLTVSVVGNGSVSKVPDQASYGHGASVDLTAIPDLGWIFVEWTGDASGSTNPLTLLMDADKTVVANFALAPLVVVSQVYGGGGNVGATYTHDFIELFNRGVTTVDLTGWSVQYAAATSGSWSVTALAGSIPPGGYYLVQEAQGAGGTLPLPTPDATGNSAMSATSGKVALVSGATPLADACPTAANIIDLVGYGSASCSETAPVPALGNLTAAVRNSGGCVDDGDNSTDFAVSTPSPRNSASAPSSCSLILTVSVEPLEGGSVSRSPDQPSFARGTQVTLTASRVSGYHFVRWSGDVTGSTNPVTLTMDGPKSVTAVFEINTLGGSVVISQIYGGGGNNGATYTHDFIELFNRGNDVADVTGWTLQYASANGDVWSTTTLVGSIPAGGHFLVQQASGGEGSVALPTPDGIGTIPIGAQDGKLALVSNDEVLTGACPFSASIVDFVAYGNANCSETAPAVAMDNLHAAVRDEGGCEDSGYNLIDFSPGSPNPRNSASPTEQCSAWLDVGDRLDAPISVAVFPNPTSRYVSVRFALPRSGDVRVRVIDLQGRVVATLAEGARSAGTHEAMWDGVTPRGPAVTGMYFVQVQALGKAAVRRISLER